MTAEEVKTYLEETYGECKHDEYAMADAVIRHNKIWIITMSGTCFTY